MRRAEGAADGAGADGAAFRFGRRIDVTAVADVGEPAWMAAEILLPAEWRSDLLFVCLPGGGMNRRYFDLPTPPGEAEASFAADMLRRGHAVALLDPLGVGDSTLPADPFLLHPDAMAAAIAVAVRAILAELREGSPDAAPTARPSLRSIGVGHSFGALLTILQQAAEPLHAALALFGFQHRGLPEHLSAEERALDPADARRRLVSLGRAHAAEAFVTLEAPPSKRPISLATAMDRVLTTPSLMALLPGMGAADAARIEVPILLALGDGDIHDRPHQAVAAYPACPDVTLLVLPDTRHNHFIYPARTALFDRTDRWAASLRLRRPAPDEEKT